MHNTLTLYIGLSVFVWILLQVMTSSESQAIFNKSLSKITVWVYLAVGLVISALLMMLPILITGTISVTGILITMFLQRFQRNAALNVTLLTDAVMTNSIQNNPTLVRLRDIQCHRARQNYGVITIVNTTTMVMSIMTALGICAAVLTHLLAG